MKKGRLHSCWKLQEKCKMSPTPTCTVYNKIKFLQNSGCHQKIFIHSVLLIQRLLCLEGWYSYQDLQNLSWSNPFIKSLQ